MITALLPPGLIVHTSHNITLKRTRHPTSSKYTPHRSLSARPESLKSEEEPETDSTESRINHSSSSMSWSAETMAMAAVSQRNRCRPSDTSKTLPQISCSPPPISHHESPPMKTQYLLFRTRTSIPLCNSSQENKAQRRRPRQGGRVAATRRVSFRFESEVTER